MTLAAPVTFPLPEVRATYAILEASAPCSPITMADGSAPSGRGVTQKDLRDRLAPGAAHAHAAVEESGRRVRIQHVGVGPVLVHAPPGIGPVIEQLAADQMTADAPHVLVGFLPEMLVTDHDVVDVRRLVGEMVEAALVAADAEECVMVDVVVAAIETIERAHDIASLAFVDLVRAAEAEHLPVPPERFLEVLRHDDEMAEALDVRGAALDPEQLALAAQLVVARIDRRPRDRYRIEHRHAVHDLDLVAVGVGEAHAPAAARLVDIFDRGCAVDPRQPLEILR